ncbi:hypothetical protein BDN72DRAFT_350156 [Pluteus cervinus]|uniref:Uncharacterized protein n=1 Tax=Pluteus cervinus TaxID=181527 RepID=A0ACD3BCA8_9AGAR|nr:hypothetical protein BDN72DRAFT_350156 [Pluteus cervinus]
MRARPVVLFLRTARIFLYQILHQVTNLIVTDTASAISRCIKSYEAYYPEVRQDTGNGKYSRVYFLVRGEPGFVPFANTKSTHCSPLWVPSHPSLSSLSTPARSSSSEAAAASKPRFVLLHFLPFCRFRVIPISYSLSATQDLILLLEAKEFSSFLFP